MPLFDQYPINPFPTTHKAGDTNLRIAAYCLVVDVSLTAIGHSRIPDGVPKFPAVIDTGNSHNFSIRQTHAESLAGVSLQELTRLGSLRVMDASGIQRAIAAFDADIWIHPRRGGREPLRLEMDGGFTCYRDSDSVPGPPFPLIGSRLLATADLLLEIDYRQSIFSIHYPP